MYCASFSLPFQWVQNARNACCQLWHPLRMRPETSPWWGEGEDIISWAACWIKIGFDATGACSEGKSCFVLDTRCPPKENDIVWFPRLTAFLPPSLLPSLLGLMSPLYSQQLVSRAVLSWLCSQSILICSGDTALFDISPKNRLLWCCCLTLRAIFYSVRLTVWKRPRGKWVIVFLTSSIQFTAATCHTLLHDSVGSHRHTTHTFKCWDPLTRARVHIQGRTQSEK